LDDQNRGVESSIKSKVNPGRATPNPREIKIMIMRSVGKISSFKISSWIIILILLFLISYFPVSILTINAYFHQRVDNQRYIQKLNNLESELDKTQKELRDSSQRLTLLQTLIEDMKRTGTKSSAPVMKEANEVKDDPDPGTPDTTLTNENHKETETEGSKVDVRDMIINRGETKIGIDFKLANAKSGADAVEGYIHLMIMTDGDKIPEGWTYPKRNFENGFPVNYKRGLPFFIERFKPYKHEFQLESGQPIPTIVRILVYNKSGSIILDEEFGIKNDS